MSKLIKCNVCKNEVSSNAKVCPHCGEKLKDGFIIRSIKFIFKVFLFIFVIGLIMTIFTNNEISKTNITKTNLPNQKVSINVCKATVATLFGRDIDTIKVFEELNNGILALEYIRPSDNSLWRVVCRVLPSNEVTWASVRDDGSIGRWRTEETVKYKISGNKITISNYYGKDLAKEQTFNIK